MLKALWELFIAFARVGVLGFGGGPSFIPLVKLEAVENFHWMTSEEFAEAFAIGNTLPGPIATKMSGFIGYKVAGIVGAVVSVAALVLPSLLAMIVILTLLGKYKDIPALKGMIRAIKPVVVILLAQVVIDFFPGAILKVGLSAWVIAGIALIALQFLKIHPVYVILVTLAYGAIQGTYAQAILGFFRK